MILHHVNTLPASSRDQNMNETLNKTTKGDRDSTRFYMPWSVGETSLQVREKTSLRWSNGREG